MGILTSIFSSLGGEIVDRLLGRITGVFEAYFKKQISVEELRTRVSQALLATFADVEKAYADSIARTFDSFMRAAAQSRLMQAVWASVALSQLLVLVWHQVGIPFVSFWLSKPDHPFHYPSSGATVDWAYALVMFCLGGGAIALKTGPGAGSLKDQLKSLVGR